jgi:hypothetical protein
MRISRFSAPPFIPKFKLYFIAKSLATSGERDFLPENFKLHDGPLALRRYRHIEGSKRPANSRITVSLGPEKPQPSICCVAAFDLPLLTEV